MVDYSKVRYSKVRYAVFVAIIGLGVALIPGLTDALADWIRGLSIIVGGLWSVWRIGMEFVNIQDPFVEATERSTQDTGFWATLRKAL